MDKRKKLLVGFVVGLLLLAAGPLRPAFAENYTVLDSTTIAVSTSMVTGATKLLSSNSYSGFVLIWATSTDTTNDRLVLGSVSGLSTTTAGGFFQFPMNTVLPLNEYEGPLWAICIGSTPPNVSVLRKR